MTDAAHFSPIAFTKEMGMDRYHNCEAKAALYGASYEPVMPSPVRHQGKQIMQRGVREAPFATDNNAPVQHRPAPQVREAPFAQHDNYAAPPRRQQAPKEVRAAPFATYDSSVTGNAYADYEKSHELKAFPKEALARQVVAPRAPVHERPFAVYDVDARENYPANYVAKPAAREVSNPKITEGMPAYDDGQYAANRQAVAANARYHGVKDAPFACGGNFDAAQQRNPSGYQARHRNSAMDGAANSGAKITGNGQGFNPADYTNARAENARIQDAQYQRKYVGAGNFLSHP